MNQADIFYHIQGKLIGDLKGIVNEVTTQYEGQLNNTWVFKPLGGLVDNLNPKRVEGVELTREDIEELVGDLIDRKVVPIQNHVKEIKDKDLDRIVTIAGDLYQFIYTRAEKEVESLEAKIPQYESAEELVKNEFNRTPAFATSKEHAEWSNQVIGRLNYVFERIRDLGKELNQKEGVIWAGKLKVAKIYLKKKLKVKLELPEVAADIEVARKAILGAYSAYEKDLIKSRYSQ